MTRPGFGSVSGDVDARRIDDPAAAKLLVDASYRTVLGAFLGRERSVGDAAAELRLDLDATLYRVRRMQAAGLLVVARERPRAGRAVKLYRAAHDAWFVPFEALPYADLEETFVELYVGHARHLARAAARWLARSSWAGYRIERNAEGRLWMHGVRGDGSDFRVPGLGATDAMLQLRLAPDDAMRLGHELIALVDRYAALDRSDEGPPNHLLMVASVPADDA